MDLLNLNYEKYKLNNGLEVILHKNDNIPIVAINIWYSVGSSYEEKGKTGLAHLFEHMMFQGSQNVPKEMHFKYIQEAGGNLNGSTSFDRTNYYEKVPSNFLELAVWLESDRMGFMLPSLTQEKLKNQIEVVSNERLERYDNQPYGLAWEMIISNLYPEGHPYHTPTIGYMNDIKNYSLEDVSKFFKKYYSPSNATFVVAGNFDDRHAKELIEKYFAGLPSNNNAKLPVASNPTLSENKVIVHKEDVQLERIYLSWHTSAAYAEDDAALDVLSDILSGSKNSRLYKNLVFDKEAAMDVTAFQFSGKIAGHFMIVATAKPGIKLDYLKDELFKELGKIRKEGVKEKELVKSKNGIKSGFIFSMQNIDSLADQLNQYNFHLNEPNSFDFDLKRYENVRIDDVKNCVEAYLTKPFFELRIVPGK